MMNVCMYIYVHIYIYVYIYVYVDRSIDIHIDICNHIYTRRSGHTCRAGSFQGRGTHPPGTTASPRGTSPVGGSCPVSISTFLFHKRAPNVLISLQLSRLNVQHLVESVDSPVLVNFTARCEISSKVHLVNCPCQPKPYVNICCTTQQCVSEVLHYICEMSCSSRLQWRPTLSRFQCSGPEPIPHSPQHLSLSLFC